MNFQFLMTLRNVDLQSANFGQFRQVLIKSQQVLFNSDNSDLIKGEHVIGKVSGASALILGITGTQSAFVKSTNEGNFIEGEEITFTESKVGGKINFATLGDKEISGNFILDSGQRLEMYDFGRLIRRQNAPEPSNRIKIFFDKFVINSEPILSRIDST